MAPQSSSEVDVIDVSFKEVAEPVPQHERRLENVRRVQAEADSLRQEICQLRSRLEEVEEESKFHAAKANELTELLMNSNSIDETTLKQTEDLAKKDRQIESLERKITQLETEKQMMALECDDAKKEVAEMSNVVRSLQKVAKGSPDNSYSEDSEDEDDDDDSEDSEEVILTPETALDLTLGNLKDHIEMLEDGLQASSSLNSTQKKAISSLEADIKAQQAQIGMLEDLFKELNAADRIESIKKKREEAKKEENDYAERPPPQEDAVNKGLSETRERSIQRLGAVFSNFKAPKLTDMVPSQRSRQPKIPEEAAAAAQAAQILVSNHENKEAVMVPKKEKKKTKMKKVKIKFKKAGLEGTYTGPLVDKKPHGVGTIRFTNGNTYLGEMTRGKMSGSGTLYTKNGVFRGLFENNQFVGESNDEETDDCTNDDPASSHSRKALEETTPEEEEEKAEKAYEALELDALSPNNIDDLMDDSFNMMANLDSMEYKAEMDEIRKDEEREANESFVKEFSGSEHSSSMGHLGDSFSSSNGAEDHEVF